MYALDNDSGVKTMPEIKSKKFEPSDTHWFTEGGNGVAPSYPGADWFNIVQAELLNILKEAKITPDKNKLNQITEAIRGVVDAKVAEKLEGKADKTHGHVVSDIQGLDDALESASKKGLPVGAIVAFPKEFANPNGFLKTNGTTFSSSAFPDLYSTLGTNQLPNLNRSDVGMTAYFATDNIPAGWIAFDDIATQVTSQRYPELYNHLIQKYGSISAVPKASDRFLRNAGNGLSVGQIQEDELKRHVHKHIEINTASNPLFYNDKTFDYSSRDSTDRSYLDIGTAMADVNKDNWWITPNINSNFATGGAETRPKSLVLKLCIKAINSFDDVVFWIKSHGEVTNAGALDAGRLAQGLQDKADLNHTHTASQITDFNQATSQIINAAITYQKIGDFEVRKYPDGTMIQTYRFTPPNNRVGSQDKKFTFNWAVAFAEKPKVWIQHNTHEISGYGSLDVMAENVENECTATKETFWVLEWAYNNNLISFDFFAIGRWK